jgi:probable F420-dependent oxidoreductase
MKLDAPLLLQDLARVGAEAARLEELGFDGVVGLEGPHDPFVPLVVAAGTTRRVRLATGIAVAFARNPMTCAYLANDLQLVSGGRFTLGLGTQVRAHITRRFGQPWSHPNARMREFVEALRAIWRCWQNGERLEFRGEFYSHTLMPPLFDPGPNPFGTPPVVLAGFGPGMVRVAGEVADGWIVHPLHTPEFLREVSLPALAEGLAVQGRSREGFEISVQTIVMIGDDDAQIAKARDGGRAQMAFYASTPAYRVVLDHHGWGHLQPILNRLSKEGRWLEMLAHVDDEMLDRIGVSGTPAEAGAKLRERYRFAERVAAIVYDETGAPDSLARLVQSAKECAAA